MLLQYDKFEAVAMLVLGSYGKAESPVTALNTYAKDLIVNGDYDIGEMLKSYTKLGQLHTIIYTVTMLLLLLYCCYIL